MQSSLHSPHLSSSEFSSVQRHFYWHDNPKLTIQPQGQRHNLPLFSSLTSLLKISSASLPPPPIMSSPFMCLAFLPSPASSLTSRRLRHKPSPSSFTSTLTQVVHSALGPGGGQSGGGGTAAAAAAVYQIHNARPSMRVNMLHRDSLLSQQQSANGEASRLEETEPRRSVHTKWSRRVALRRAQY